MYKKLRCRHTQPTVKELSKMRKETDRLIDLLGPPCRIMLLVNEKLDELGNSDMKIKPQSGRNNAIHNWRAQGRIPYHYVDVLVRIDEVAKAGFTHSSLRPDVKEWHLS